MFKLNPDDSSSDFTSLKARLCLSAVRGQFQEPPPSCCGPGQGAPWVFGLAVANTQL